MPQFSRLARSGLLLAMLLAGCDDHAPSKSPAKLPLPKSDSSLDSLIAQPPARPAHLVVSPPALRFAAAEPGQDQLQSLLLRNEGGTPLTLAGLRLAGQSSEFGWDGDCQAGLVLAGGAACTLQISYRPLHSLPHQEALVIDQGSAGPAVLVTLHGPGLQLPAPPPAAFASDQRARGALGFARQRQLASFNPQTAAEVEPRRLRDPDYSEAGLPGVVSSLPVDRSRVITADRMIPAVLENSLNSQLPGRAIAVVDRPVFGAEGRLVLIPAGSRVIGRYRSQNKYGLARLEIAWSRILRPDGVTINLDADSADVMGRAGIPGDLDERQVEKYGSSLLVSIVAAAGDWALAGNQTAVTSPLGSTSVVQSGRTQAANRLGNDVDRLAQRMIEDAIDVRPVLIVPQGTRLLIIPSEDLWLQDSDHLRKVTPPKGKTGNGRTPLTSLQEMLPLLAELLLQSPEVQKAAPRTAQEILQSSLLQQLSRSAAAPETP